MASFRLINALVGGMSHGIDPRTHQRAERLYQGIIRPILEANKPYESEKIALELVDVGAGSGSLSAAICHEILNEGLSPKFRLWFVDLEPANPTRFFRNRNIRIFVDNLTFLGDDYRDWLSRPKPLPDANCLRIALVSKLFNNLSRFSIRHLSGKELSPFLERTEGYPDGETCFPSICLAPGGKGEKSLVISNTRVSLQDGKTFVQLSLSTFYQGLYLLSRQTDFAQISAAGLFLPIRSFAPECLITKAGKSVISCSAANCDYIIVEDADLRPRDLVDHAFNFSLGSLTIRDMTKTLKLKGNYIYVIWPKREIAPLLAGEQIW
ncbi:MAG: hypothetical protein HY671_03990 [Chloroflexi bacterium]|nr:hypothetical protein [Chloroflexota bacterium]